MSQLENLPFTDIVKIVIPGVLAFLTGSYLAKRTRSTSLSHESFHELYDPMFKAIKPYIYKTDPNKAELLVIIRIIKGIAKSKSHLVVGSLDDDITSLISSINNDNKNYLKDFDKVCWSIEKTYIKLKKALGYPTKRDLDYHMNNISVRRIKVRSKIIYSIFQQISFVLFSTFVFILLSTLIYNWVIDGVNWLISLGG